LFYADINTSLEQIDIESIDSNCTESDLREFALRSKQMTGKAATLTTYYSIVLGKAIELSLENYAGGLSVADYVKENFDLSEAYARRLRRLYRFWAEYPNILFLRMTLKKIDDNLSDLKKFIELTGEESFWTDPLEDPKGTDKLLKTVPGKGKVTKRPAQEPLSQGPAKKTKTTTTTTKKAVKKAAKKPPAKKPPAKKLPPKPRSTRVTTRPSRLLKKESSEESDLDESEESESSSGSDLPTPPSTPPPIDNSGKSIQKTKEKKLA